MKLGRRKGCSRILLQRRKGEPDGSPFCIHHKSRLDERSVFVKRDRPLSVNRPFELTQDAPKRRAPQERCAASCFGSKPGGVMDPFRSSVSSRPMCTPARRRLQAETSSRTGFQPGICGKVYLTNSVSRSWSRPTKDFVVRKREKRS
jgi:hypothetical protein